MKILLDPQIFLWQKFGGVSRLFVELLRYSRKWGDPEVICPIGYTENLHLKEVGLKPKNIFSGLNNLSFRGTGRIKEFLKSSSIRETKKLLRQGNFDVFFPSYYDTYFLDYLGGKPFVIVVHDMTHEVLPEYFLGDKTTVPRKKLLIENASRVITNSIYTKNDILQIYPHIPEKKIVPVHHAQSIENPAEAFNFMLPESFILFVGNRGGYKNFLFIVEALSTVLHETKSLYLVCAGGGKFSEEENKLINKLGLKKKVIQKNFRDHELPTFYMRAKVFIFPSLYEGFGIPTLEAMKCGCPVIVSDTSCFPEIAGNAGLYFNPRDPKELLNAVKSILEDANLRIEMIDRGYKRVVQFSWAKTAQGYFKTIEGVIT